MNKFALFGYSGHSFVIADAIRLGAGVIIGYYDKEEAKFNPYNLKYLGDERNNSALTLLNDANTFFFVAIGDNRLRKKITESLTQQRLRSSAVIHPSSIISNLTTIGEGTLVAAGAKINPLARIGIGAIINTGSIVEHECIVSDFAHIGPGAVLTGNVCIGEGTFIGANAVIKQGVTVGNNVIVGAGAVVLKDITDNQVWVGNPAKEIRR